MADIRWVVLVSVQENTTYWPDADLDSLTIFKAGSQRSLKQTFHITFLNDSCCWNGQIREWESCTWRRDLNHPVHVVRTTLRPCRESALRRHCLLSRKAQKILINPANAQSLGRVSDDGFESRARRWTWRVRGIRQYWKTLINQVNARSLNRMFVHDRRP